MISRGRNEAATEEKIVYTTCNVHCGGQCILKVHVKNGIVTKIETDDGEEPQYRACAKGRARRQELYAPDRLKWPLKRVGARGEGKFERISWDEALDTVAREIKRVRDTYGPAAILCAGAVGDMGHLHSREMVLRLFNMLGGFSGWWGVVSFQGGIWAALATYGTDVTCNGREDLINSRLIIMWGWDPARSITETNSAWYLLQAKEAGAKIISVDPKYTDSAATFAHQWIPIIPGTDTAMLVAMAYVMIKENLQHQRFLDTYTVGFDRFSRYVMGEEDGVAKSPAWAETITGVPAATIEDLARKYATTKPAALIAGCGPGRTAYGEQFHRATMTLAAMTGNVGVPGGDPAGRSYRGKYSPVQLRVGKGWDIGHNPVDDMMPPRRVALPGDYSSKSGMRVHRGDIANTILKGRAGGYPADYKLLYVFNSNLINQYSNTNKIAEALRSDALEFIVSHEQFMTPMAKFADIVLPHNNWLAREDVYTHHAEPPFYGFKNKVIDSLDETRSPFEVIKELAVRLGVPDFCDLTEDEWLRELMKESDVPDYEAFKQKGSHKTKTASFVVFQKEIEDPKNNPFPTPSGKIEIYSQRIADMNIPELPPIPKYIETWESRNDPLAKKYPLQLITCHPKLRAHSQFYTIPWLTELEQQAVMINSADAQARGIGDGDMVMVFNDRGKMIIPARVTERIMPGVVEVPQGAWYNPDDQGIDRGGCANVLTRDAPSPAGTYPANTSLVEVQKA